MAFLRPRRPFSCIEVFLVHASCFLVQHGATAPSDPAGAPEVSCQNSLSLALAPEDHLLIVPSGPLEGEEAASHAAALEKPALLNLQRPATLQVSPQQNRFRVQRTPGVPEDGGPPEREDKHHLDIVAFILGRGNEQQERVFQMCSVDVIREALTLDDDDVEITLPVHAVGAGAVSLSFAQIQILLKEMRVLLSYFLHEENGAERRDGAPMEVPPRRGRHSTKRVAWKTTTSASWTQFHDVGFFHLDDEGLFDVLALTEKGLSRIRTLLPEWIENLRASSQEPRGGFERNLRFRADLAGIEDDESLDVQERWRAVRIAETSKMGTTYSLQLRTAASSSAHEVLNSWKKL